MGSSLDDAPAQPLKYYVYIYRDPTNKNVPVYVGKGQADRAWIHAKATERLGWLRRKCRLAQLELKPEIIWCLTERHAFALEHDLIFKFGLQREGGMLLNRTHGTFVRDLTALRKRKRRRRRNKKLGHIAMHVG